MWLLGQNIARVGKAQLVRLLQKILQELEYLVRLLEKNVALVGKRVGKLCSVAGKNIAQAKSYARAVVAGKKNAQPAKLGEVAGGKKILDEWVCELLSVREHFIVSKLQPEENSNV